MRSHSSPRAPLVACVLAFPLAALIPAGATAQERIWRPEGGAAAADIVLYREPNYGGAALRAQRAVPDLGVTWPIRSLRVERGEWQLCRGVNYTGTRIVVRGNVPGPSSLGVIRSVRPVSQNQSPGVVGNAGPSLRGMAAEFFTEPAVNGSRVVACLAGQASAACARQTAQGFCRSRGYNYVGNVAMQSVGNRVYLADVLCRRTVSGG